MVYSTVMKYVLLAIFVLFAAQPVQASFCDMHDGGSVSDSQHGHMDDNNGANMDCCDHDPSIPSDNCDSISHCGANTTAVASLNPFATGMIFSLDSRLYLVDTGDPASRPHSPPFRPPIA